MDTISWFAICVIAILVLFVMVVCVALLIDRQDKHNTRVYELRVSENGNVNLREKKTGLH